MARAEGRRTDSHYATVTIPGSPHTRAKKGVLAAALHRAGVRALDDVTNLRLVEHLEPLAALDVFQMTANPSGFRKTCPLFGVDLTLSNQLVQLFTWDRPAFSLGEGLSQIGEIAKGFHHLDILLRQVGCHGIKIESTCQVMRPSTQHRLPMQRAPQPRGAQFVLRR